jgi:hypothetical protein
MRLEIGRILHLKSEVRRGVPAARKAARYSICVLNRRPVILERSFAR